MKPVGSWGLGRNEHECLSSRCWLLYTQLKAGGMFIVQFVGFLFVCLFWETLASYLSYSEPY